MYSIQETARITGFSPYTLRYYERQQVLPPVARDSAGNRDYSQEDIHLLEIIRCLKNTGMPVNDIGKFISLCQKGDGTLQQRLQVAAGSQMPCAAENCTRWRESWSTSKRRSAIMRKPVRQAQSSFPKLAAMMWDDAPAPAAAAETNRDDMANKKGRLWPSFFV